MAVTRIALTNFRSYTDRVFNLDPGVTLIVGPNGSGKTNILEALYVFATTKSFRARDEALIQQGSDVLRIEVASPELEYSFAYQKNPTITKKVTHNGVKKSLRSHVGTIPVVLFEPGDLQLLAGPPSARRVYMDTILCQTDPDYLQALNEYKRALKQRNALLRDHEYISTDMLFAWNVQLVGPGLVIRLKRQGFVDYLHQKLPQLYESIAGKSHELEILYQPSPAITITGESDFLAELEAHVQRDSMAGFTTIGPHRDDLQVMFDGHPIDARASRGEHRSVVLALKLAELDYQSEFARSRPLFMLDDVFSELDAYRRGFLLEAIGDYQTIVTTTEADTVKDKNYYTITLGGDNE
jgi:DNA replication and repair protein RecF